MSNKLLDFSKYENSNSKFIAELSPKGGNIVFSNSGKGGNKKYFTLGLDSFLNVLIDIKNDINAFKGNEIYDEKKWRELGSNYYQDKPANAQCTVQTKSMFSTLSKIIIWANTPLLDNIDPEKEINLEKKFLDNAIRKVSKLSDKFTPTKEFDIDKNKKVEVSSDSIREFALNVFIHFYKDNWDSLIKKSVIKNSKINDKNYQIIDFNKFKNLIGVFSTPQNKSTLSSSGTSRYFENEIYKEDDKIYYFTTQWNAKGDYDLSFSNLKEFIESEFPKYVVVQEGKTFFLKFNLIISTAFNTVCELAGLTYKDELTTRYISSLVTKPFVLLSGLSGSGKTKLAQSFAQWICEDENQYKIVPVGADWTNREPLLGYINALEPSNYILPENGALELIIRANEDKDKPYFLILDEMNLSHVERYFADFLSVMESKDKFKLHSSDNPLDGGNGVKVAKEYAWPKNLFVVGTVNIDETTYMFSPKVLDRANVIEFRVDESDMKSYLETPRDIKDLNGEGKEMGNDFVNIARSNPKSDAKEIINPLHKFFTELQTIGAEFGYRTASEIQTLFSQIDVINPTYIGKSDDKIDIAIMQKLLPKLHGSRTKLVKVLNALAILCYREITFTEEQQKDFLKNRKDVQGAIIYPISLQKIERMYDNLIANGFTSYAEA